MTTTEPPARRGAPSAAVLLLALFATLLSVAVLPGAPAGAAGESGPTWLPDWELNAPHTLEELSRAFDRDEDGRVDPGGAQVLPNLLNPDDFTLRVDACVAPPGFTSIDWRFTRPGEDPLEAVTVTECETELALPDRPYPEAREYTLTATVHYPDAPSSVVSVPVRVQDVFMVGLGDSYGSGEGNPLEYWDGEPFSAPWDNDRCHRSRQSGQEQAARMLEQLPGVTVTFLHLACSGALASEGVLGPYAGLIPRDPPLPPQIDQAAEYVQLSAGPGDTPRYPDLVVTSIGGNDAGFAEIVKACLLPPVVPKLVPLSPYVVPWPNPDCYDDEAPGGTAFDDALEDLVDLYRDIDTAVDHTLCPGASCEFLITEYPDGATDDDGDICSYHAPGFTGDEFEWARQEMVPRLNGVIATAAGAHDWTSVDGVLSRFDGHGICAEDDWFRDILESFEIQGDENGAFHPNAAGHAFGYAPAIADAAREALGFPYRDLAFRTPLYGGTGQPPACDDRTGDGVRERFVPAPETTLGDLPVPDSVRSDIESGALPTGTAAANSCVIRARAMPPTGQGAAELRAGLPGCPDDPRPCADTSGGSSTVRLPSLGEDAVVNVRTSADAERRAGQPADPFYRRASDAVAEGRTAFLAVGPEGAETVAGEIVIDLTTRAQASGASSQAEANLRVDASIATDAGPIEIGRAQIDITRFTCREDDAAPHGCRTTYGHPANRFDERIVRSWDAAGEPIVDIDEDFEDHTANAFVLGESVHSGFGAGLSQLRLPFEVPAGSVIVIDAQVGSYATTAGPCVYEENTFPCTANARSTARIGFATAPEAGVVVPLVGFGGPAEDTTAPEITGAASGEQGGGGWYRSDVDLTFDATDEGGSGVASVTYQLDGAAPVVVDGDTATVRITQEGPRTATFWATDGAGNESARGQLTVRIDRVAPTIALSVADGAQVPVGQSTPTGLACTDARSGVATCEGPATLDTSTPGTRTATFTATDVAGNAASRTITYRVLSAAELVDRLKAQVDGLGLPQPRHAELASHVESARRSVARNDVVAACDHLTNFDTAVRRAVQRRWLTSAQADPLLATSRDAQIALGCPAP